jgi:N-acetylmuramoyl-L-alanine amidase-like protein
MSLLWYPTANTTVLGNSAGAFDTSYPMRGVIHTTEGASATGAFAAYRNANSWPHFTVGMDGIVYQHIPVNVAARSLKNASGGVETNRAGAIQIEVCGKAAQPNWPLAQVQAMILLMRWLEQETGIRPVAPAFHGGGAAAVAPFRFSPADWRQFGGWCGHQHVPENDHWDPGALVIANLLPTEVSMPENPTPNIDIQSPPGFVAASIAALCDSNGVCTGYLILGTDGGVFGFGPGARYFGRVS